MPYKLGSRRTAYRRDFEHWIAAVISALERVLEYIMARRRYVVAKVFLAWACQGVMADRRGA